MRFLSYTDKFLTASTRNQVHCHYASAGRVPRHVATPNQHILAAEDVVSCCLDLSVPSISFRINGHPVQGMFENFNLDGLFFPAVSFSAGVKYDYILIFVFYCILQYI